MEVQLRLRKWAYFELPGPIYPTPRKSAYELRIQSQQLVLVQALQGKLRHPKRGNQLHKACKLFSIPVIPAPRILDKNDPWMSGYWDSDGSITIANLTKTAPVLSLSVSSKDSTTVQIFQSVFRVQHTANGTRKRGWIERCKSKRKAQYAAELQ